MSAKGTLVSTDELAQHPQWRLFDCRHDLMKPGWGREEFLKSHIPGAHFASMDEDLSGPKSGMNGRHPLPSPETFIAWLGKQGLKVTDQVVCYDNGPGVMASRLWWMLRWVGHDGVAVLNGGIARWEKEGRPLTADVPDYPPTRFAGQAKPFVVDAGEVLDGHVLLDARAPARYRGEQEPIDPVAGRIPGALNRFSNDNVQADGRFKSADALKQEFLVVLGDRKPAELVNYCGSGVSACHNLLAMEIAGLKGARLYPGSWSEWIADPARPRAP